MPEAEDQGFERFLKGVLGVVYCEDENSRFGWRRLGKMYGALRFSKSTQILEGALRMV